MRVVKCTGVLIGLIVLSVSTGFANGARFVASQALPMPHFSSMLTAVDMDGDGSCDLVAPDGYYSSFRVFWNPGDGVFEVPIRYPGIYGNPSICCADLDRDGNVDLIFANTVFDTTYMATILNNGDRTFQEPVQYLLLEPYDKPFAIDLNGDLFPEIVLTDDGRTFALMFNNGDGSFQQAVDLQITSSEYEQHRGIAGGDFDGDGDNDLAVTAFYVESTDSMRVLLNNGDGTFQQPATYEVGELSSGPVAADLDNDGDLDIAAGGRTMSNIVVLLNNGDATFETRAVGSLSTKLGQLATADLDNDGYTDIAAAGSDSALIGFFFSNGDGTFGTSATSGLVHPGRMAIADFDADGDNDIGIPDLTEIIILDNKLINCCGQYTGGYTGNTDCSADGNRTLNDITALVDYVFISHGALCCEENGNVDGSSDGKMTLNDITKLIDNIFISHGETAPCQ